MKNYCFVQEMHRELITPNHILSKTMGVRETVHIIATLHNSQPLFLVTVFLHHQHMGEKSQQECGHGRSYVSFIPSWSKRRNFSCCTAWPNFLQTREAQCCATRFGSKDLLKCNLDLEPKTPVNYKRSQAGNQNLVRRSNANV